MALLVNTRYKIPWIVWKREYSILVASGDEFIQTYSHGLSFTPLLLGQWSTNANFSPSYDLGVLIPGGSTGGQPETMCSVSASASYIHFDIINNAVTQRTFYLRLMGFAPPDYNGEVAPVEYNSAFRFNSHYRYQQIYMQGRSSGNAIAHNLGYLPQARIWAISGGQVLPAPGILTTSTLSRPYENSDYYYHIYKDAF